MRVDTFTWTVAIRDAALTAAQNNIALTLATFMDWDTGENARPGIRLLTAATGLTMGTISTALKQLEDMKWIICTHPPAGRRAAVYAANIPGDIWQEIANNDPQEQMRRSVRSEHTQTPVAFGEDIRNDELSTGEPSDGVSVRAGYTQKDVAFHLRIASPNTPLTKEKNPPTPQTTTSPLDTRPLEAGSTSSQNQIGTLHGTPVIVSKDPNPASHKNADLQRWIEIAKAKPGIHSPEKWARKMLTTNGPPPPRQHPGPGWNKQPDDW